MRLLVRNIELGDVPKFRTFKCGNPSMDWFLYNEAYRSHITGEGITKVVIDKETNEIIAYYTLKADALKIDDDEMYVEPRYIPCIEVSRIAVVCEWQKGNKEIHLGTHLLGQIITFIKDKITNEIGCRFITLHAVKEKVKWYQEGFGFVIWDDDLSEDDDTIFMYLEITDPRLIDEYNVYKKNNL